MGHGVSVPSGISQSAETETRELPSQREETAARWLTAPQGIGPPGSPTRSGTQLSGTSVAAGLKPEKETCVRYEHVSQERNCFQ